MGTSIDALSEFKRVFDDINSSHKKALRDLENALHMHRSSASLNKTQSRVSRRQRSYGTEGSVSSYSSSDEDDYVLEKYGRKKSIGTRDR